MNTKKVTVEIDPRGVARVTLNNPDSLNAFDEIMIQQLTTSFQDLAENKRVRVVILDAAGKAFCAGADVSWMKKMARYSYEENIEDASALAEMLAALNRMPQPTLARVQGAAFGGGVGLVSCCDMAVASSGALFCFSEVKIGLSPSTISPYVIAAIGQRAARRYFLTAERFSAKTACDLGLVSSVVEDVELDSVIEHLITTLLANSPAAMRSAKSLVADMANKAIDASLIRDTSCRIAEIRVTDEAQEGLQAFLNKRTPSWCKSEDQTL